jgi:hypothetical protein
MHCCQTIHNGIHPASRYKLFTFSFAYLIPLSFVIIVLLLLFYCVLLNCILVLTHFQYSPVVGQSLLGSTEIKVPNLMMLNKELYLWRTIQVQVLCLQEIHILN